MRNHFAILILLLAGCVGTPAGDAQTSGGGDSTASTLLSSADRSRLDNASGILLKSDYQREQRVSVTEENGDVVMGYSNVTSFSGPAGSRNVEVVDSSSVGDGDAAIWVELTGQPFAEDTLNWSRRLLTDDPLVLNRQGSAYYHYEWLPDTVLGATMARRIGVQIMEASDRAGIHSGTFYLDPHEAALIGFDLRFAQRSLLFDEDSRFAYLLQPDGKDAWIPLRLDVHTFLNLPLSKGQTFELHTRYELTDEQQL